MAKTKNFRSKLHLACGNDNLRQAMMYIQFKDGYAQATTAHILIKSHLSLHDFTKEEIKLMEGKFLHKDTFVEVFKYDYVEATKTGLLCTKGKIQVEFKYAIHDFKFPNIEQVWPKDGVTTKMPISEIFVDLRKQMLFKDIFTFANGLPCVIKSEYWGEKKQIVLTTSEERKEVGLLMPVSAF